MAKQAKAINEGQLDIQPIEMRGVFLNIIGTSPLIPHRFAQKAWQELLLPSLTKNRAALESTLKHDPLAEYRGCFYRNREQKESTPTLFHLPSGMIHGAMTSAALDIAGVAKAQLERLTSVTTPTLFLYGVPQMFMSMVRNSDQKRTPDVRTRPIFKQWAIRGLGIEFKRDVLGDNQIANLLAAAGIIVGVGDWRPQKGGSHGKFRIADNADQEMADIIKLGSRAAQEAAYEDPTMYDDETADLFAWFNAETSRRERRAPSAERTTAAADADVKQRLSAADQRIVAAAVARSAKSNGRGASAGKAAKR